MRGDARDKRILACLPAREDASAGIGIGIGTTAQAVADEVGQTRAAVASRLRSMKAVGWVTRARHGPRPAVPVVLRAFSLTHSPISVHSALILRSLPTKGTFP